MSRFLSTLTLIVATLLGASLVSSDQIQPLLDVGEERQISEKASQIKIDSYEKKQYEVAISEFSKVPLHGEHYSEAQHYIDLINLNNLI